METKIPVQIPYGHPTKVKIHFCWVCKKVFKTNIMVAAHMKNHLAEEPYQCRLCFKEFIFPTKLKIHEGNHLINKCDDCPMQFDNVLGLLLHRMTRHTPERPYECDMCELAFKRKASLANHQRIIHTDTDTEDSEDA
ncbi:zinc finger protein ZFP2-like [Adelges cooleyi]|uniref:zinc finger protein ZFP2-like n=1 Tax=Adelges cooleyi TaxID=133065 RepID=UPI00217FF537|nr:zinc finger protein ZFP2-like [Adelges cooleyi]